jgi:hypothetical protein
MAPSPLSHGDCAPGAGAEDCITSPGCWCGGLHHADFVGLSSGAPPVSSDLTSCLSRPALPCRQWRVVELLVVWVDILLDVISGVESALREGCPRTMTGVSQSLGLLMIRMSR